VEDEVGCLNDDLGGLKGLVRLKTPILLIQPIYPNPRSDKNGLEQRSSLLVHHLYHVVYLFAEWKVEDEVGCLNDDLGGLKGFVGLGQTPILTFNF